MGLYEIYDYYWNEMADPRTKNMVLNDNISMLFIVPLFYLYIVLVCGPRFMKNRPAYDLRNYTRIYNAVQVIANYWMVRSLIQIGWFTKVPLYCDPQIMNDEEINTELTPLLWWNLIIKLAELSETVVFVLRKKNRQISFLHLYHHTSTLLLQWVGGRYIVNIMASFLILLNSSVHVVMYSYYFLSTFPKIQRIAIRFKPLITIIQMVQFCILLIYICQAFLPGCPISRVVAAIALGNIIINFVLFYNFYQTSYVKPKKT